MTPAIPPPILDLDRADRDAWFTPASILSRLGEFDLDPCNSMPNRHPTAKSHFTPADDGLKQPWHGRVWLNPPFSASTPWVDKMIEHANGISLLFCRSDAGWFHRAVASSSGMLMLHGRTAFWRPSGKISRCPLGCVLVAFGESNAESVRSSGIRGLMLSRDQRILV